MSRSMTSRLLTSLVNCPSRFVRAISCCLDVPPDGAADAPLPGGGGAAGRGDGGVRTTGGAEPDRVRAPGVCVVGVDRRLAELRRRAEGVVMSVVLSGARTRAPAVSAGSPGR
ncbi:MAG: hypothetical protein ACRDRH_26095 [Pseudonocardia sp.]